MDPTSLVAALFVSSVGYVLFSYGKRMRRVPHTVAGLVLLVFPYFIHGVAAMLSIAMVLVLLTWLVVRVGW